MFAANSSLEKERVVAIYGRVSTEHEAQLSALKNQLLWHDSLMERHPEWTLYQKYIDEGITGTQAKKRPSFLMMIEEAKQGKFDLIVARDVTRFARNTVDTLNYCRELKEYGVEVYLVNDGISSFDKDGEYRLTIMAANAQDESRKTSERVKAGQYSSRLKGVLYGTGNILGYDRQGKTFVINPEQAETVRMIFQLYIDGLGIRAIRTELMKADRKNSKGVVKWFESSISRMLSNPMYIGKQYQKQTEVVNFLTQKVEKKPKNEQILIEGNFEPIIKEDDFNKVAAMKALKATTVATNKTVGAGYPTDLWMTLLECDCGARFQQYKWRKDEKTGNVKKGYSCRNRINNGSTEYRQENGIPVEGACDRGTVCDWHIELMTKEIFESIWGYRKSTVSQLFQLIKDNFAADIDNSERIRKELDTKIKKYRAKIENLIDLFTDNETVNEADKATFFQKKAEFEGIIKMAETDMKRLKQRERKDEPSEEEKLAHIKAILDSYIDFEAEKIDRELIRRLLDKVIARSDDEYEFYINLTDTQNADVFNIAANKELNKKRDNSIRVRDERYKLVYESVIGFDRARAYRKKHGTFLRMNQWTDLKVKLYVR